MNRENLTGIICAMQEEAETLLFEMTQKEETRLSGIRFTRGMLCGQPVVVAVSGIGKVFAAICTEAMILHFAPRRILNAGVAGSLTKALSIGHLAIASAVVQHDMDVSSLGDPKGLIPGMPQLEIPCDPSMAETILAIAKEKDIPALCGVIASGDLFVHTDDKRKELAESYQAIACEMESGAIAHVCYVNHVDCGIIRAISDSLGGDATMEYSAFETMAAAQAADITMAFLMRLPVT